MYSVFNVDLSKGYTEFWQSNVYYQDGFSSIYHGFVSIIRGSSTVNGDSAHSSDPLAKEHNYVSFYVRSIEIIYDFFPTILGSSGRVPSYIILFKLPYDSDQGIRMKLLSTNRIGAMILYTHPECVLAYDVINLQGEKSVHDCFLRCNKPFVVGPNDFVGVYYYIASNTLSSRRFNVEASAKVVFKPQ